MSNDWLNAYEFVACIYTQFNCDHCLACLTDGPMPPYMSEEALVQWAKNEGWIVEWADRIDGVSQKCPECAKKVTI